MLKKTLKAAGIGFLLGIVIGNLIAFLTGNSDTGGITFASAKLLEMAGGNAVIAMLLQSLFSGLYGAVCFAGMSFYEIERMPLAGEDVVTSYQGTPLPEAAKDVLARYEAQGDCLLCEAGYLDLQGNVWGCVVQGDGWVEVQVVKSVDGGTGSELSVVHMDAQSWAQQLEGLGEEGS